MQVLLNIVGVMSALVIVLAAIRVFQVADGAEISGRTALAFAVAAAGFYPVNQVINGEPLPFGQVLLLFVVAIVILHRVWVTVMMRRLEPRRHSDFAELL